MTFDVDHCRGHHDRAAAWRCGACNVCLCDDCVSQLTTRAGVLGLCPDCREPCVSLAGSNGDSSEDDRPFVARLPDVLLYPVHGRNLAGYLALSVLTFVGGWFAAVNGSYLSGWYRPSDALAFIVVPMIGLWIAAAMIRVAEETLRNEPFMPIPGVPGHWWDDLVLPVAIGFAPWFPFWGALILAANGMVSEPVAIAIAVVTFCYAPMAMLAAISAEGIEAALPHVILPAMWRTGGSYLLLLLLWLVGSAVIAGCVLSFLAVVDHQSLFFVTFVTGFATAIGTYLTIMLFAMLGYFYHANRERIGWSA